MTHNLKALAQALFVALALLAMAASGRRLGNSQVARNRPKSKRSLQDTHLTPKPES